jgi:hypothetical protein
MLVARVGIAKLTRMIVRQGEGYLDRELKRRAICRRGDDAFQLGPLQKMRAGSAAGFAAYRAHRPVPSRHGVHQLLQR